MSKYFLIFFFCIFAGCSSTNEGPASLEINNKNTPEIVDRVEIAPSLPLSNVVGAKASKDSCKDYRLETGRDDEFNFINIIRGNGTVSLIKLPTGLSQNGFGLNFAKKTRDGFLFSVEYGSRFYYEKEFRFVCKGNDFYLTKIAVHTHDQADPERSSRESIVRITPNVLLDSFAIADYMKE